MSAAQKLPARDAEDARREALGAELSRLARGRVEALGLGSWREGEHRGERADEVLVAGRSSILDRSIAALEARGLRLLGVKEIDGEWWAWLAHPVAAPRREEPPLGESGVKDDDEPTSAPPSARRPVYGGGISGGRKCPRCRSIHAALTKICRACLDRLIATKAARGDRPAGPRGFASMSPERRREVSSAGGRIAGERGWNRAHGFTSSSAKAANRMKRRHAFSRQEASDAGKLGGRASAEARSERRESIGIETRERR